MSSRLRRSKLLLHFRGGAVSQNGYEDTEPAAGSIIGPVPMLARGLALETTEHLDGALLDINLAGERCFPIAEALKVRDIPFAFLTGYVDFGTPPEYRGAPLLAKHRRGPMPMLVKVDLTCPGIGSSQGYSVLPKIRLPSLTVRDLTGTRLLRSHR